MVLDLYLIGITGFIKLKLFWILILSFFICSIQEQTVSKLNIDLLQFKTKKEISFDSQVYLWYEMKVIEKINLIIKLVEISDQNLRYQIEDVDEDSTLVLKAKELIKIKDCMDNNSYTYYLSYESDLQIGTVILECMNHLHMFRD